MALGHDGAREGSGRPRKPLSGIRLPRADPWLCWQPKLTRHTAIMRAIANALRRRSLNYRQRKHYRAMVNLSNFMWKAGSR